MRPTPRSTLFPYTTLFRSGICVLQQPFNVAAQRWRVAPQVNDVGNCCRRRNDHELLVITRRVIGQVRSEEHTSELQSQSNLVCRLLLEKKKKKKDKSKSKI